DVCSSDLLDSGNPLMPPIRMRSPLWMVANGVSDSIATLSLCLPLPLQWRTLRTSLCVIFLIFSSSIRSWFIAAQLLGQCPNIDYVVRPFFARWRSRPRAWPSIPYWSSRSGHGPESNGHDYRCNLL